MKSTSIFFRISRAKSNCFFIKLGHYSGRVARKGYITLGHYSGPMARFGLKYNTIKLKNNCFQSVETHEGRQCQMTDFVSQKSMVDDSARKKSTIFIMLT